MQINIILILIVCVVAFIALIAGIVKGFGKTSYWGGTVLFTVAVVALVGKLLTKDSGMFMPVVLACSAGCIIVLSIIFSSVRKGIKSGIEKRRELSGYQTYDDVEENRALILNAVDNSDKHEYKKLRKQGKKIKVKSGGWGVVDRIFGGISGALNAAVGAACAIFFVLIVIDFAQIQALDNVFGEFLASGFWASGLSKIAFDLLLISLLSLTIRAGFKSGISSLFTTLVIIGLLVAFGYISYTIASSEMCAGAVDAISVNLLGALPSNLFGMDITAMKGTIAKFILTALFFLFSVVIVIIVGIFLPKLVDKFRKVKVFYAVDGFFGALLLTAFVFGLLLVAFGVAYTLNDLAFMEKMNGYMQASNFADCLYAKNPLGSVFANLPIRGWFNK